MLEKQPFLLTAVPQLLDPNFARGVVLLLHHDSTGAMGLVINQPTTINLESFSLSQKITCHSAIKNQPLFKGGPVEPQRGWVLHADSTIEEKQEVLSGIYLSVSLESLKNLFEKGSTPLRFILGYSGWGPGQLEQEMKQGGWLMTPSKPEYIFGVASADLWKRVINDLGIDPTQLAIGGGVH